MKEPLIVTSKGWALDLTKQRSAVPLERGLSVGLHDSPGLGELFLLAAWEALTTLLPFGLDRKTRAFS